MQFHIEHITDILRREVETRFPQPLTCSIADTVRQCFHLFRELELPLPVLYVEPPVVITDVFEPQHIIQARRSGLAMVHVMGSSRFEAENGNGYVILWVNRFDPKTASRHVMRKWTGDVITETEADDLYLELVGDATPTHAYLYHKAIAARQEPV